MIIRLEGATHDGVEAASRTFGALAQSWGYELAPPSPEVRATGEDGDRGPGDKAIDPVSVAALVLAIPPTVLAVADLADRIQKRLRAKQLIDHARDLTAQQHVTVVVVVGDRALDLAQVDPDHLLDVVADESAG